MVLVWMIGGFMDGGMYGLTMREAAMEGGSAVRASVVVFEVRFQRVGDVAQYVRVDYGQFVQSNQGFPVSGAD